MSTGAAPRIRQEIALLQEVEIATCTIEAGLAALAQNRQYAAKPYWFTWMLLLSTGLERLMKVIVCLHELETNHTFPKPATIKRLGHDLHTLRTEVVTHCFTPAYQAHVWGAHDYHLLTANDVVQMLFDLLNDFAKTDRYLFLDRITNPTTDRDPPYRRWEELEKLAISAPVYIQLLSDNYPVLKQRATQEMQGYIEQIVRALMRLFVVGELGAVGKRYSFTVSPFVHIADDQLGRTIYREP